MQNWSKNGRMSKIMKFAAPVDWIIGMMQHAVRRVMQGEQCVTRQSSRLDLEPVDLMDHVDRFSRLEKNQLTGWRQ